MKDTFRRDFESIEEFRERLARDAAGRSTFEPDIGKVLDAPAKPASDLVSDEIKDLDGFRYRVRVYANGTRITTSMQNYGTPPAGGDFLRPGNAAAKAAFKAGREEEYIDRMRSRFGGEW
jgi:hypothetical protein